MARVASIVIQDCDPYESEDDDKLWTVEELLLFEGTHKEQLLCLDKQVHSSLQLGACRTKSESNAPRFEFTSDKSIIKL